MGEIDLSTFGGRLEWLIEHVFGERKQAEFSRRMGVKPPAANRWIQNQHQPSEKHLQAILELTGVSEAWLLLGVGEPFAFEDSRSVREETPEYVAAMQYPDPWYLKPQARAFYDHKLEEYEAKWTSEIAADAARALVAFLERLCTLRWKESAPPDLSDDQQLEILKRDAIEVERVFGRLAPG